MRFNPTDPRVYLVPALGLALVTAMSACSSSSSSSSSSASASTSAAASGGSSSAVAEITANWNEFFNSATPNSKRIQLLQNGSVFSSAISSLAASPLASGLTSKVDSVKLTSATQAAVKYDLSVAGQSVAKGQTGSAVLQNGTWKVGDNVFCGLLTEAKNFGLSVTVPSVCSSAG